MKKSDQEKLSRVSQVKSWGALFFIISMRSLLSERLDSLRSLTPGHFLTAFFNRIRVDRVLNHAGAWFQKDAFSVGGFTGFSFLFPPRRQSAPESLLAGYDESGEFVWTTEIRYLLRHKLKMADNNVLFASLLAPIAFV